MSIQNPSFFDHNMEFVPETSFKSIIKVIGIGGGGSNAVQHMFKMNIKGADLVVCNTDSQALASNLVKAKVKLGEHGLGAGTDPEVGRKAAEAGRHSRSTSQPTESPGRGTYGGVGSVCPNRSSRRRSRRKRRRVSSSFFWLQA